MARYFLLFTSVNIDIEVGFYSRPVSVNACMGETSLAAALLA